MSAFWPHADSIDWWDGPDRFKRINRCEVAMIQNETLMHALVAILPGRKLDVGGPPDSGIVAGFEVCNLVSRPGVTVVCDACELPYDDDGFALVFSAHTVEHIHNPDAFMAECARILAPGGLLYLVCPDRRYVRHSDSGDPKKALTLKLGERTYEEFAPEELLARVRRRLPNFEILSFDTRQNQYDFEVCMRRPG